MKYSEAISFLHSFISYERSHGWKYSSETFDLSGYKRLLSVLGNPQLTYPTIHIAGSDGKGSVAAMLATVLQTAGFRVGLYISPHLHDLRERITVNQEWISKRSLAATVNKLRPHLDVYGKSRRGYATFFDLLTAAAFLHFQRSKVDVAVIETGLGGRLDATNVLEPEATVITRLSLEHTELLGDTLEKIAAEKLAICHPGIPCIIAPQCRHLLPFIRRWLKERAVPAHFVQKEYVIQSQPPITNHRKVIVTGPTGQHKLALGLLGAYQPENAATVCAVIDVLRSRGGLFATVSKLDLRRGLKETIWPGRFEVLRQKHIGYETTVVLDVAHTARGAASLRKSLRESFGRKPRVVLLGFLRGKDVLGILKHLVRQNDTLVCTAAPSPRGIPVPELKEMLVSHLKPNQQVRWCEQPARALDLALNVAGKDKLVVVTGSLYLVGLCRAILLRGSISG